MTRNDCVDMTDWHAETISHNLGVEWVERWHYTHHDSSACNYWGTFNHQHEMMAVVCIGLTANQHGVAKKFKIDHWRGNLEIKRVVAHPLAPYNTASKAIALTCDLFAADGWEWLFSYADVGQDHHGGIYQSLNAVYVGASPSRNGWRIDGKLTHPRTIVSRYGTQGYDNLMRIAEERGIVIEKVRNAIPAKHIYILLIGPPSVRRAMRKTLAPYIRPYPKRADHDATADQQQFWEVAALWPSRSTVRPSSGIATNTPS